MKKFVSLMTTLCFAGTGALTTGCASTHHGEMAASLDRAGDDLKISAEPIPEFSDPSDIYLDFTVENTGSRWIKIDQVTVDFPTPEHAVHNVIVGDDLKTWAESENNKMRMQKYNSELISTAMFIGGLAVSLLGFRNGDTGMTAVGLTSAAVGGGIQVANDVGDRRRGAQTSFSVPENYILAPFTVPSHGFLRKWLLVNIPEKVIAKKALITLKTIEGETLRYEVPIVFHGNWQTARN